MSNSPFSLSYWEQESFLKYDIIIIGSGIVGLSSACSILEKYPSKRVLILERGLMPTGASTRNAGFACFGSLTEILSDLKIMGEEQVFNLVKDRYDGLQFLRKRLGDSAMNYQQFGGYELLYKDNEVEEADMKRVNKLLRPLFGRDVFSRRNELISVFGFNQNSIETLFFNPFEGQIHSGKMMQSLLKKATSLGATILTGCNVLSLEESPNQVSVLTQNPLTGQTISFQAEQAIVCTNGFSQQFFPEMDIYPGRGQVILTEPLEAIPFHGTFHIEDGFYYFRDIDNRVLLGGGRNLDIAGETTTDFGANDMILNKLYQLLAEIILPDIPHKIDMEWTGIMAFGKTKTPIIEKISPRIIAGVRMCGMGVALGSNTGLKIADLLTY